MSYETRNLFGVDYAVVDYEAASDVIIEHAARRSSFGVSALAVHGLVTAVRSPKIADRVRRIPMVVPDGQPVRWALNRFRGTGMKDRVYGPTLTLHVLRKAAAKELGVYLFGSTEVTLRRLSRFIETSFPQVRLCGTHVDRFRDATPAEDEDDVAKIRESGAHIVLVGRGCPLQEIWVAEHLGRIDAVLVAVGAAFDFHAGVQPQAPRWLQDHGLEWLYRLLREPRRLWRRYLGTNSYFLYLCLRERLGRTEFREADG